MFEDYNFGRFDNDEKETEEMEEDLIDEPDVNELPGDEEFEGSGRFDMGFEQPSYEDEEEEDDEEYIGDDDIAIQVSADNAAIIKAALNNFESTKSTLLSPSKSTTFMKPKICPGDPNININ